MLKLISSQQNLLMAKFLFKVPVYLFLLLLISTICGPKNISAQQESEKVVIGNRVVPPFVIEEDGEYSGLSVTLWDHIAEEMDLNYRFEETGIQEMLEGVASGSYYASAAALTITSEREAIVDFTHPYYVTGLGIAVSYQPVGLWQSLLAIFSAVFLWVVFLLLLLLLCWGILAWFFERYENPEEFGGSTAEGIGSGSGGPP